MRFEPCEDNPSVNIVTRSGIATGEDKVEGKKPISNTWVCRVGEKNVGFDLQILKEMFMEERIFFMDPGVYTSKNQIQMVPQKDKSKEITVIEGDRGL